MCPRISMIEAAYCTLFDPAVYLPCQSEACVVL
jgi:hypothetical protein